MSDVNVISHISLDGYFSIMFRRNLLCLFKLHKNFRLLNAKQQIKQVLYNWNDSQSGINSYKTYNMFNLWMNRTKNGRQESNLVNESRMNISPAGIAISFISIVARLLI